MVRQLAHDPWTRAPLLTLAQEIHGWHQPPPRWVDLLGSALDRRGGRVLRRQPPAAPIVPIGPHNEAPELDPFAEPPPPLETFVATTPQGEGGIPIHAIQIRLEDAWGRPVETDIHVTMPDGSPHEGRTGAAAFEAESSVGGIAHVRFPSLTKEDWPLPPDGGIA